MAFRRNPTNEGETAQLLTTLREVSHPLASDSDLDPLLEQIGEARYVLLGEASHGTSEFYTWRARLSQRLIREKGFAFIAVEGDWPDCYAVNRYIKDYAEAGLNAHAVLDQFSRWPTWMWANWEVVALVEWLRTYNQTNPNRGAAQIGFYGLDVYSLWESMDSIIEYLEEHMPEALDAAKRAYLCFEPYSDEALADFGYRRLVPESCEDEVVELLSEVRRNVLQYPNDPEATFDVEQNALVALDAERYYHAMLRGGESSWNIRDRHMVATLDRLITHYDGLLGDGQAKAIVWEHNTHIGDARATDMAANGMVNVGQLVREQHGQEGVFVIGCGSHHGSVIAGNAWDAPISNMVIPLAQPNSWEDLLHQNRPTNQLLFAHELRSHQETLAWRGHRAIGVVYEPDWEAQNYVPTVLPNRYDAFLFIDETEALHPLHQEPRTHESPETYPWGV